MFKRLDVFNPAKLGDTRFAQVMAPAIKKFDIGG